MKARCSTDPRENEKTQFEFDNNNFFKKNLTVRDFHFFGSTSIWRRLILEIDAKSTENRRKPKIANTLFPSCSTHVFLFRKRQR